MSGTSIDAPECPVTGAKDWRLVKRYTARPGGETDFGFSPYHRDLIVSPSTGHLRNVHSFDLSDLYAGDYWNRTYGDGRIGKLFDKIMALPTGSSDNRERVAYVLDAFVRSGGTGRTVLDVGSGLCVFPAAMREAGWEASALDPDPRSADHARDKAGVQAVVANFMTDTVPGSYALITFNKVLEHVPDPVAMLAKAAPLLADGGRVYVELPDGEAALAAEGPDREEFFIEHFCAFSAVSYAQLAMRAGFDLLTLERVIEPSGKYTLRGLLRPASGA